MLENCSIFNPFRYFESLVYLELERIQDKNERLVNFVTHEILKFLNCKRRSDLKFKVQLRFFDGEIKIIFFYKVEENFLFDTFGVIS